MEYIVIMPAYNEELLIENTIQSLIDQTVLPKKLIVVNDGSTDRTPEIVQLLAAQHPWITLINHEKKEGHAAGAKVVRAFYVGYNTLNEDYDVLVKLDADLELPHNYFEGILNIFEQDPKVGIAGGTIIIEKDGKWVYENFSDKDHVKGAFKAYRKGCFKDIGGLKHSIGWDSADELLARFHGWTIKTDTSLEIKHFRVTGHETGLIKIRVKVGYGMYRLRYGLPITIISAIKAGIIVKPYLLTGLAIIYGFLKAWWRGDDFMVSKAEGKFIRNFRWKRTLSKLNLK